MDAPHNTLSAYYSHLLDNDVCFFAVILAAPVSSFPPKAGVIARDGGPIVFKGGGAGWMRRTLRPKRESSQIMSSSVAGHYRGEAAKG